MSNKKILVLVLSTNAHPWRQMEIDGQDSTWKRKKVPGIEVKRYYSVQKNPLIMSISKIYWNLEKSLLSRIPGNKISRTWKRYIENFPAEVIEEVDELSLSLNESYPLIGLKTLRTFEAVLKLKDFDYVYRTNVSSYVDLPRLAKFVETLDDPNLNFYGGANGKHKNYSFASGSGYLIGRNTIRKVVDSKSSWDHSLIDDVALAKLLFEEHNIHPSTISRIDLDSIDRANEFVFNDRSNFHYRCKSKNLQTTIAIMKIIDQRILSGD